MPARLIIRDRHPKRITQNTVAARPIINKQQTARAGVIIERAVIRNRYPSVISVDRSNTGNAIPITRMTENILKQARLLPYVLLFIDRHE